MYMTFLLFLFSDPARFHVRVCMRVYVRVCVCVWCERHMCLYSLEKLYIEILRNPWIWNNFGMSARRTICGDKTYALI